MGRMRATDERIDIGCAPIVRVAATELREIAEQTPDLAVELRRIADELEGEVADLESS